MPIDERELVATYLLEHKRACDAADVRHDRPALALNETLHGNADRDVTSRDFNEGFAPTRDVLVRPRSTPSPRTPC